MTKNYISVKIKNMNSMQYRFDKRKGKQLSALGLGCMRFPGGMGLIDKDKTEKLLLKAYSLGINYYDTAYIYPGSEEVMGEVFKKNNLREKVYIATKMPQVMCNVSSDFDRFFDIQKQRLQTGYIDYYLLHNITDFIQYEKLIKLGIKDWISCKKKSGEIMQIGFSFHGTKDDFIKVLDDYDWDFVQIQYNYIQTHYQAGIDGLHYAAKKDIPVIIMEPLLGGKLANLPKKAAAILKKADSDINAVSLALRFVWNESGVTVLLSGMNQNSQLEENLAIAEKALPGNLTETEKNIIEDIKIIFNKNFKIPCTGCKYCMPCPKKINIPDIFEAYNNSFSLGRKYGTFQYLSSISFLGAVPHFISDCSGCGKCEKHCPQKIEIRKFLKTVHRKLGFPLMKAIRFLALKFLTK